MFIESVTLWRNNSGYLFSSDYDVWTTIERQIAFYEVNNKKKTKKFCVVNDVNRKFTLIVKYLGNSFLKDDANIAGIQDSSAIS